MGKNLSLKYIIGGVCELEKFSLVVICLTNNYGYHDTSVLLNNYCLANKPMVNFVIENVESIADKLLYLGNTQMIEKTSLSKEVNGISHINELFQYVQELESGSVLFIEQNQPLCKTNRLLSLLSNDSSEYDASYFCDISSENLAGLPRVVSIKKEKFLEILPNIKNSEPLLSKIIKLVEINGSLKVINNSSVTVIDEKTRSIAENTIRKELIRKWQRQGVIFDDPTSVQIDASVRIQPGASIGAYTIIRGCSIIQSNAKIHSFSHIQNALICEGAEVMMSYVIDSTLEKHSSVGPYAFLRGNTVIKDKAQIGAYSEINDSIIGEKSKCKHFSYIGHTNVSKNVNIGAGTITCTYDGVRKYSSKIEEGAFIGSGTLLVAPANIGRGAITGAGSVVTKEVSEDTVVYGVPAKPIPKKLNSNEGEKNG